MICYFFKVCPEKLVKLIFTPISWSISNRTEKLFCAGLKTGFETPRHPSPLDVDLTNRC